ncbi:hypothetical protein T484DRAFT_1958003 [Baffinella frigidus]|nr:hypothetical protein T484DRAFT_1958003 [Cryptophyta sp. CCMP2293]
MSCQHEYVNTVKEMMAEVMREKKELVERLNEMHQGIEEEEDLLTKVLRKVEWMEEKERSVEALNRIVASLQDVLEEEDMNGEMAPAGRRGGRSASQDGHDSTASREDSDTAASRHPRAFSQSFNTRASALHCTQPDFELTLAKYQSDLGRTESTAANFIHAASEQAGAAEPRHKADRASSAPPLRKFATWPLLEHPARCDKADSGDTASTSASNKATELVRSLSASSKQLPRQVRNSLAKNVRRVSSSVLRTIGWHSALQVAAPAWEYSV